MNFNEFNQITLENNLKIILAVQCIFLINFNIGFCFKILGKYFFYSYIFSCSESVKSFIYV